MKQTLTKSQYWALRDYRDARRAQSNDTSAPINDRESCQREARLASARIARADKVLFPPTAVITIECDGGIIERNEVKNRFNIEPVLSIMKTCAKNFSKTDNFNGVMGHISRKAWLAFQNSWKCARLPERRSRLHIPNTRGDNQ